LQEAPAALILMVTSGYALLPSRRAPTYSATKAGLHSFTMALRRQLDGTRIRVVEVLPPVVDTAATAGVGGAKMPPAALVEETMRGVGRGRTEILPGRVRFLPALMRAFPRLAARIVAES
ncbi:MAG TPA: SDR family NAD(P)-dependent oxidoreductase, partial [Acetobacteraceae bacterium]